MACRSLEIIGGSWVRCFSRFWLSINGHAFGQMTVQMDGAALTIPKGRFVEAYLRHPHLRNLVDRYHAILLTQAQQNAACHATPLTMTTLLERGSLFQVSDIARFVPKTSRNNKKSRELFDFYLLGKIPSNVS
jgi:hypothetical protein